VVVMIAAAGLFYYASQMAAAKRQTNHNEIAVTIHGHACEPNAEAVLRRGRMVFYALEPIPAGAEITIDYGEEHVALYFTNGCRCPTCRPA